MANAFGPSADVFERCACGKTPEQWPGPPGRSIEFRRDSPRLLLCVPGWESRETFGPRPFERGDMDSGVLARCRRSELSGVDELRVGNGVSRPVGGTEGIGGTAGDQTEEVRIGPFETPPRTRRQ